MGANRWFSETEILDVFDHYWPKRLARNLMTAAALRCEYLRGERDGWESANRDDYDDEPEGCVLGEHCCHHDPFHTSAECFSAEDADAYFAEAPADER